MVNFSMKDKKIFVPCRGKGLEEKMEPLTWIGKAILSAAISWLIGQVLGFIKKSIVSNMTLFRTEDQEEIGLQ